MCLGTAAAWPSSPLHPAFEAWMRAFSSGRVGLWSLVMSTASKGPPFTGCLPMTHRESPTQAVARVRPFRKPHHGGGTTELTVDAAALHRLVHLQKTCANEAQSLCCFPIIKASPTLRFQVRCLVACGSNDRYTRAFIRICLAAAMECYTRDAVQQIVAAAGNVPKLTQLVNASSSMMRANS